MTIRRLYGSSEHVGGGRWELFMLEDPTQEEQLRWTEAHDALFPPAMPDEGGQPLNDKEAES
ncbi:MAG TPA: hypothetical protein VHT75_04195 [Acidimicrobiales bacterium]|jgi:hypothetical protein|nr:hypothetical protein [Acidimicrobiales bacterium]